MLSLYRKVGEIIFNREVIGRKENHLFMVYEIYSDDPCTHNHEFVTTELFSEQELQKQLREQPQKFGYAFCFLIERLHPSFLS